MEEFCYTSQSLVHDNSRRSNRLSRNSISYNSEDVVLPSGGDSGGGFDGASDALQYQAMRRAMHMLAFSEEKQDGVLDVLAVVLHLGNIDIEEQVAEPPRLACPREGSWRQSLPLTLTLPLP